MITRLYTYIGWLSLDVTAGAIVFSAFLAKLWSVDISWIELSLLGMSVWLIYTADHLLDVRVGKVIFSERRLFHRRNSKVLIVLGGGVCLAALVLMSYLPYETLKLGLLLGPIAIVYLVTTQFRWGHWLKEFKVALGYAVGVSLAPAAHLHCIEIEHCLMIGSVGLIALSNLLIFSFYEKNMDMREGFSSMAIGRSGQYLVAINSAFVSLCLFVAVMFVIYGTEIQFGVWLLIASLFHATLLFLRRTFKTHERYRLIGDAMYLIPIVWLI